MFYTMHELEGFGTTRHYESEDGRLLVVLQTMEHDEGNPDGLTRIELRWDEVREVRTNKWGQRYNVATGTYRPKLNVSHWHRSGEMWASFGLGRDIVLDDHEPVKRRTFATLARITREYTPEACRALATREGIDASILDI